MTLRINPIRQYIRFCEAVQLQAFDLKFVREIWQKVVRWYIRDAFALQRATSGREFLAFTAIALATLAVYQVIFFEFEEPRYDSFRYLSYAVNILEHGTFGLTDAQVGMSAHLRETYQIINAGRLDQGELPEIPQPGAANTPLYPVFLASAMWVDNEFREMAMCTVDIAPAEQCSYNFRSLFIFQSGLALLSLLLIWQLTRTLFPIAACAWFAAAIALFSGELTYFSGLMMTENLVLPLFLALMLLFVNMFRHSHWSWSIMTGVVIGLLTLARPSYLYLFFGLTAAMLIAFVFLRRRDLIRMSVLIVCGFSITLLPWLIRNHVVLGEAVLTENNYSSQVLAERVAFNKMTAGEIIAGFVFYFPDFGDDAARFLFPEAWYNRLGWDEGSYYKRGSVELWHEAGERSIPPSEMTGYLIRTEILGNPFKHAIVSLPLAWRAIFPAKYWGIVGFVAFTYLIAATVRNREYGFVLMSLPVWGMVAFHALVSVSIYRYNLPLIGLYSIAMAWVLVEWTKPQVLLSKAADG